MKNRIISLLGNNTLIVSSRDKLINIDNKKLKYNIEQVGILDYENLYFEMEGKEFCGNGLRAAGICLGIGNWKIKTNVYPYNVLVKVIKQEVSVTIPVDMYYRENNIIKSEGIAYAFENIKYGFSNSPCEGIINVKQDNGKILIYPKLWIKDINTIIDETACASGSIATVIYLKKQKCEIIQPSGGIYNIEIVKDYITLKSDYKILL